MDALIAVGHAPVPGLPRCWRMREDCEKAYLIKLGTRTPGVTGKLRVWLWDLELPCLAVYRFGQLAFTLLERNKLLGAAPVAIYLALQLAVRVVLHVDISHRCRIGPGLHLGHPYGILIGPTEIGANCNLTHQVTIGMGLAGPHRGLPVIGDDVWIGPGAILTGALSVGRGATIGAGAVVSKDVPPRALVVGNPGRVVFSDYDNSALLVPAEAEPGAR